MPWYRVPFHAPKCRKCGCRATCEVFNTYNATAGYFCEGHGKAEVDSRNEKMRARVTPPAVKKS